MHIIIKIRLPLASGGWLHGRMFLMHLRSRICSLSTLWSLHASSSFH